MTLTCGRTMIRDTLSSCHLVILSSRGVILGLNVGVNAFFVANVVVNVAVGEANWFKSGNGRIKGALFGTSMARILGDSLSIYS